MAAKNKFRDKTDVIENAVIHVFGSILNISVPGRTNLATGVVMKLCWPGLP